MKTVGEKLNQNDDFLDLPKEELLKRVGNIRQLGYVELQERADGPAKGSRQANFRTAKGLQFEVLMDRGLDIPSLYYKGTPLVWRSPVSETHPSYYDAREAEWLRNFFGGLLTTCGLTHFGPPSEEDGEGLHGRISNRPAKNASVKSEWEQDKYVMKAFGEIEQSKVFGENLVMKREVETALDEKKIRINDVVKNEGFRETPHMILYHMNVGYPLLDKNSELEINPAQTRGVDERASDEINGYDDFLEPQEGYEERVYEHQLKTDEENNCSVAIFNDELAGGIGLKISFRKTQLPYLMQWKMMGQREYVLGLEPANCKMGEIGELKKEDEIPTLSPQESREYNIEVEVLEDKEGM